MTNNIPNDAFILAAGKGTRLRPYTDDKPKPMVDVAGKPILHHTVEKLEKIGVKNITINLYYLGDRIKNYFKNWRGVQINFSEETELLETGGGIKLALNTIKNDAFYIINGDALWSDGENGEDALLQLAEAWDPTKMDILLLLQPVSDMNLTEGVGDYNINDDGTITRTPDQSGKYMFTGLRISNKGIFKDTPEGAFSYLQCMDAAQQNGRLYGVEYKGQWHHISTPQDLDNVNDFFAKAENNIKKKA